MPAARCVGAAPSVVLAVSALSWGALLALVSLASPGAVVPGATGTLPYNGRVGGRLDAWRGLCGAVVLDLLVSL